MTSNPTIFNAGDPRLRRLRRPARAARARGPDDREIYQELAIRDIQDGLRRAARRSTTRASGYDGYVSLRGRPRPRLRHRPHDGAGARVLGPRRPPQPDDQDPGHRRGRPGDRGDDLRGAATSTSRCCSASRSTRRWPRPTSAASSAASRRASRVDMQLGRLVLRLARGHRGRQAPGGAPATTTCSARPASPTRAPPTSRFEEIFLGERFAAPARRRRRRPAPAVGVDRREEPGLPATRCTSTELVGAEHRQHDADGHAAGRRPTTPRSAAPTADERPGRGPRGAGRRRHRPRATSPTKLLRDGVDEVRRADGQAARGHRRPSARRSSPSARRRSTRRCPTTLEPRVAARVKQAAAEDVARRIWRKDDTLWGPAGAARGRQPPRLADRDRADARGRSATCEAFAAGGARRGHHRRRAAGHGRLVAGARGHPPLLRRRRPAGRRLHVLDSTDAGAIRARRGQRIDLDHTLFLVSTKSGGTIETLSLFEHFWSLRSDGQRVRRHHRPGLRPARSWRARARLPAHVPQRPRHRRALQRAVVLRARARGADGRRRGRAARRAPASPSRTARRFESRRRATRAVARARAGASCAQAGRDKLTYVIDPPLRVLRPVGRAAHRRVDRQAGQGHRAGRRRAARRRPTSTATTASSCTCATPTRPTRRPTPRSRRCATAGHPVIVRQIDGPQRPRADLLLRRVRDRRRRLGAGDQPVRPAQRAGGQGRHQAACWPRAPRTSPTPTDDELRALLGGLGAPQLPGGHGLRRSRPRTSTPR